MRSISVNIARRCVRLQYCYNYIYFSVIGIEQIQWVGNTMCVHTYAQA